MAALRKVGLALTTLTTLLLAISAASTFAQEGGYDFTPVAFLGDPAPGGSFFTNDFEPTALNSRGDLAFTADLTAAGQEGIFLLHDGQIAPIMRFGQPAPGGGVFGPAELGNIGLNDEGDLALAFSLDPLQLFPVPAVPSPFVDFYFLGGIYRRSHLTETLQSVLVPGITPVPGGGTFLGDDFNVRLNNQGELVFLGAVASSYGPSVGVFMQDRQGQIRSVVRPGDPAPGGGAFVFTLTPWINDGGDVAFQGWRSTDLVSNIYLKRAATGDIVAVTRPGQTMPGGGVLASVSSLATLYPILNSAGEIAFTGFVSAGSTLPPLLELFLYTHGTLVRVVGPGDPMPGGGHLTALPGITGQSSLNDRGEVAFNAALDTGEEGLYVSSGGSVRLVAKTGTVIPGVGTLFSLEQFVTVFPPSNLTGNPSGDVVTNDRGQIAFACTLADGRGALLLATPKGARGRLR